jgi:hypothetical protein
MVDDFKFTKFFFQIFFKHPFNSVVSYLVNKIFETNVKG